MTNEHIAQERIMELALDEAHPPRNGEARHLAGCARCAEVLERERRLTAQIMEIAPTRIPPGFEERAVARFVDRTRAQNRRHMGWALGLTAGIATGVAAAAALAWSEVIGSLATIAGGLATVVRAAVAVAGTAPMATVIVLALLCAMALAGCWLLAAMVGSHVPVKYPARRDVPRSEETSRP